MAAQIDRYRQAGNVGRVGDDVDRQRGDAAAHILGTDAKAVDPVEDFAFHIGVEQFLVIGEQVAAERLFGKQGTHLGVAADAHADNQRGAGASAVFLDAADHIADDVLAGGAGVEHLQRAGVLAACALRDDRHGDAVARHQTDVDDGRGVVLRIDAVERVVYHRHPQVALLVCLAHALVDGVLKQLAHDVYILPDFGKDDHHAGVLADGQAGLLGNLVVVDDISDGAFAVWRDFIVISGVQRQLDVRRQEFVGAQAQVFDGAHDGFGCDDSHGVTSLRSFRQSQPAAVWRRWSAGPVKKQRSRRPCPPSASRPDGRCRRFGQGRW